MTEKKLFGYISAGMVLLGGVLQMLKIPVDTALAAAGGKAEGSEEVLKYTKTATEFSVVLKLGTVVSLLGLAMTITHHYYQMVKNKDGNAKVLLWLMYIQFALGLGLLYLLANTAVKVIGKDIVTPYISPLGQTLLGLVGLGSLIFFLPRKSIALQNRIASGVISLTSLSYFRPIAAAIVKSQPYALVGIYAVSATSKFTYLWLVKATATKELEE